MSPTPTLLDLTVKAAWVVAQGSFSLTEDPKTYQEILKRMPSALNIAITSKTVMVTDAVHQPLQSDALQQ